jgi:cyclohexanone monooxygenase
VTIREERPTAIDEVDAIVVGAGFAGIYMLYALRAIGMSVRLIEAAPGVGGVWYWNRYPGARCDVESADYSYSFSPELEQDWVWTERYSRREEILAYLNHVVDRFALRELIDVETRVDAADYRNGQWVLTLNGQPDRLRARFCIMTTGCLSVPKTPEIKGLDDFQGQVLHTARWPDHDVSFGDRRVAIIGVGSSGTQLIPLVAREAGHLYVLQRTPNYTLPGPNQVADPSYTASIKATYRERRAFTRSTSSGMNIDVSRLLALEATPEERAATFEQYWLTAGFGFQLAYADLLTSKAANDLASEFLNAKIREVVHDPEIAATLTPRDQAIGAKRPAIDAEYFSAEGGYYESFNRPNVTIVDLLTTPIEEITPTGIRTTTTHLDLDTIVFATGFDAMTGSLLSMDVRGRGGTSLADNWRAGPLTYLGLAVSGFPNLFIVAGPGSPSVLSNVVVSIEQHVEWLAALLAHAQASGVTEIEASSDAQAAWVDRVNAVANATLYPTANSWYLGANIPGKPRVFMPYAGGLRSYRRICDEIAADDYRGFDLRNASTESETLSPNPDRVA